MMRFLIAGIALAALFLTGCATSAPPSAVPNKDQTLKQILDTEGAAIHAFGERNAEKAASFYAPDATLMMANSQPVTGSAVKDMLAAAMADPNYSMTLTTSKIEAARSGELGYSTGSFALTMTDPNTKKIVRRTGKYLTVYAKHPDGTWKIIDDITTPDGPAAPAQQSQQ
jgi:ketosteroid isomerase-like protein